MPWNGSGVFNRSNGVNTGTQVWQDDAGAGVKIRADRHDTHDQDIADGMENTVTRDGQNSPSANLPMATYRHTGVGNAVARTDYAAAGQVQDGAFIWCGTAGGTANAITLTPTPAITAYAAGQRFRFKAGATQSDNAVTIAVSGLATKAAEFNNAALSATSYIEAGKYYDALYDGTAFQLTRLSGLRAGEVATANIADDAVTYAKIQNVVTNGRLLGRTGGNDGPVQEVDLPSILAFMGDTRGQILRRGASGWEVLTIGANGTFLSSNGTDATWATPSVVQSVNTQTGAVSTGTTTIPSDDTIPQNTEGDEYMTLAITPTNASNILEIDVVWNGSHSAAGGNMIVALFQDSTANALAATFEGIYASGAVVQVVLRYRMVAGTSSATTFKVRAGQSAAGTTTFNGVSGGRYFGGVMASSITIRELKA